MACAGDGAREACTPSSANELAALVREVHGDAKKGSITLTLSIDQMADVTCSTAKIAPSRHQGRPAAPSVFFQAAEGK